MKIKIPGFLTEKFVPDLESVNLLEYFLISAVVSLLGIRAYLNLAGYPQLGAGDFHIAHMLWGGLFMMASIFVFSSFINSHSKVVASVLGGIGFGTFIDELGKFVTADNDYFYQPTIAIVYLVFIAIFLFVRRLSSVAEYSPKTYFANAIEGLRELVIHDLDASEKSRAIKYLKKADSHDHLVQMMHEAIKNAKVERKPDSTYTRAKAKIFGWYKNSLHVKIISRGLVLFFIVASAVDLLVSSFDLALDTALPFSKTGSFLSAVVVFSVVVIAVRFYSKKKLRRSYEYLQRATLVAIFFTQFFRFLENQLSAMASLLMYVSVYLVLKYAIEAQRRTRADIISR